MKKLFCILLAVMMLMLCVSCGGGGKKDRLAQIKEKGVITVATEPYFAPYEFIDPSKSGDDKYVGMDIEIAKYIANKIGVELKIVPLEFTAVQAGIADGKYDMALSAMAYSPSRAEAMNLSNVYMPSETGYGFLVREADKGKYNSIESLKDAVVITQSGSVQESMFNDQIGKDGCAMQSGGVLSGGLAELLALLADNNIDVEYMYSLFFHEKGKACMVLRITNEPMFLSVLGTNRVRIVGMEELGLK